MGRMSWNALPVGLLRMGHRSWRKLDSDVQQVVVQLAVSQKYRCDICHKTRALVIDHDHYPDEGPGYPYTVFNIRGLVCQRCNWHLMAYEKRESGEYFNWENADSYISDNEYESYDYKYRCRVSPLIETALERRMGSANYWRRKLVLQKFDAWFYDGERSEWRDAWAQRRAWKIETPEQFIKGAVAITKFVAEQLEKDPNYEVPDEFIMFVVKTRRFLKEVFQEAGMPLPQPHYGVASSQSRL